MEELLEKIPKHGYERNLRHRHHDNRIINNRLRFLRERQLTRYYREYQQPHRMVKRHPMDCGKTKCYLCHGDKLLGKSWRKTKHWFRLTRRINWQ